MVRGCSERSEETEVFAAGALVVTAKDNEVLRVCRERSVPAKVPKLGEFSSKYQWPCFPTMLLDFLQFSR